MQSKNEWLRQKVIVPSLFNLVEGGREGIKERRKEKRRGEGRRRDGRGRGKIENKRTNGNENKSFGKLRLYLKTVLQILIDPRDLYVLINTMSTERVMMSLGYYW